MIEHHSMLITRLRRARFFPTVVIDDDTQALTLAQTLLEANVDVIEIAFRTKAAAAAIRAIRGSELPIFVAAGTLRSIADMDLATQLGVAFGVSPGATPPLIAHAHHIGMPWLPGAATPSEIMALWHAGYRIQKLFPADLHLVDAMAGPFPQIALIPTGGIDADNATAFVERNNVLAVSGTWIAPRALIAAGDFLEIRRRAEHAMQTLQLV